MGIAVFFLLTINICIFVCLEPGASAHVTWVAVEEEQEKIDMQEQEE